MKSKKIDLQHWKRKDQYNFFKNFDQPFFNITADIEIESLYRYSKKHKLSFFYCILHSILKTVNEITEFRYRLVKDGVFEYSEIDAGVTILMEDKTFIYCTIKYKSDLHQFVKEAIEAVEKQKKSKGFLPHERKNLIYVSAIPWVSFTGFQHARQNNPEDSVPRFVLGKFYEQDSKMKMPFSVEVHHALADGYHLGQFYEKIQEHLHTF